MAGRLLLLGSVWLAACGGPSSPAPPPPSPLPQVDFERVNGAWTAKPVRDALGAVSHEDGRYTGEIDRYLLVLPAAGRLQVALTWNHAADFDVVLASDPNGASRLAEGTRNDLEAEYLGIPVVPGQVVYAIVVGWEGEPGAYTLETVLMPHEVPAFALTATPDLAAPWPRNRPIVFTFNQPLDPEQNVPSRVLFVTTGHEARGFWCVTGSSLAFFPHLPEAPPPFDDGGMAEGATYTIQFPRGGRGVRAKSGEYLSELWTGTLTGAPYEDEAPAEPPRVTDVDWNPLAPWDGRPIHVTILGQLDPLTVAARFERVRGDGSTEPLPTLLELHQAASCVSSLTWLRVEPMSPPPARSRIRLVLPGRVRGISGAEDPENRLTGRAPAPGGEGFEIELTTP